MKLEAPEPSPEVDDEVATDELQRVGEAGTVGLLASIPGFCFFHLVRRF